MVHVIIFLELFCANDCINFTIVIIIDNVNLVGRLTKTVTFYIDNAIIFFNLTMQTFAQTFAKYAVGIHEYDVMIEI